MNIVGQSRWFRFTEGGILEELETAEIDTYMGQSYSPVLGLGPEWLDQGDPIHNLCAFDEPADCLFVCDFNLGKQNCMILLRAWSDLMRYLNQFAPMLQLLEACALREHAESAEQAV